MGLLQKAVETYDTHAGMAGAVQAGHQPLAPVSHIVTGANIEITLDAQRVRKIPKGAPNAVWCVSGVCFSRVEGVVQNG